MKLIIEIPDEIYNFIMQRGHLPYGVNIAGKIIDGEVLPKNYGDLIDRDALIKKQFIPNQGFELVDLNDLMSVAPIIPANKEEKE